MAGRGEKCRARLQWSRKNGHGSRRYSLRHSESTEGAERRGIFLTSQFSPSFCARRKGRRHARCGVIASACNCKIRCDKLRERHAKEETSLSQVLLAAQAIKLLDMDHLCKLDLVHHFQFSASCTAQLHRKGLLQQKECSVILKYYRMEDRLVLGKIGKNFIPRG